MKKLLLIAALSLAAFIGLPMATASSAQSLGECDPHPYGAAGRLLACAQYTFRLQNDGTGIYVDHVDIDLYDSDDGCGDFESTPGTSLFVTLLNPSNDNVVGGHNMLDMADCHAFRTIDERGPDTGPVKVVTEWKVRVNNAPDYWVKYRCTLRTDLTSDNCNIFEFTP